MELAQTLYNQSNGWLDQITIHYQPETQDLIIKIVDEKGIAIKVLNKFQALEMIQTLQNNQNLRENKFDNTSVLPMTIINDDDSVKETIICNSISGGKDYVNDMPRRLSLILTDDKGKETRAEYIQVLGETRR